MKTPTNLKMFLLALSAGLLLACGASNSAGRSNTDPTGTATSKDGSYGTGNGGNK